MNKDEQELAVGQVQWHSSEEDGGPDVGILLRLDRDHRLWLGELLASDGDGMGFVVYGPERKEIVARLSEWDEVREVIEEYIAPALRTRALVERHPMPKVPELFEHGEALDWITANCMAIRRDNGNMDYSLGALIAAYEAGKAATPTAAQPQEADDRSTYERLADVIQGSGLKPTKRYLSAAFLGYDYARSLYTTPPQAAESGLLDEAIDLLRRIHPDPDYDTEQQYYAFLTKAGKPGEAE